MEPQVNSWPIGQPESIMQLGAVPIAGISHPQNFFGSGGRRLWMPTAGGQKMPAGAPGWMPTGAEPEPGPEPGAPETTAAAVMPDQNATVELELSSILGITVGTTITVLEAEFDVTAVSGLTVTAERTSAPPPPAETPIPEGTAVTIGD